MRRRLLTLAGRAPGRRRIGAAIGLVGLALMRRRRRVAADNLRAAFPAMTAAARGRLLRRHFVALGETLMDTLWAATASPEEIRRRVRVEGELPKSCLLLTPHFLGLEVALLRLADVAPAPLWYYHKPMHSEFWGGFVDGLRRRFGAAGLSTGSRYSLLAGVRRLREGCVLCYLPDVDPKARKSTVFAPFLGVARAATTTGLSRLAKASGAAVATLIICRSADGYVLRLSPPLADFPGDCGVDDAARMNKLIGEWAERQPENYFWLHRRFKTVAAGDEKIYQ